MVQDNLARWTPGDAEYRGQKLRLANWSAPGCGRKPRGAARGLRFYAPGLTNRTATPRWIGIRHSVPAGTKLAVNYRSVHENYRIDSRWERRSLNLDSGVTLPMADGSVFSWVPAWGDRFCGEEGDLLIRLSGKKGKSRIHEVIIWSPEMEEHSAAPSGRNPRSGRH